MTSRNIVLETLISPWVKFIKATDDVMEIWEVSNYNMYFLEGKYITSLDEQQFISLGKEMWGLELRRPDEIT